MIWKIKVTQKMRTDTLLALSAALALIVEGVVRQNNDLSCWVSLLTLFSYLFSILERRCSQGQNSLFEKKSEHAQESDEVLQRLQ